jgi:PAS domain S-box-containing protein
VVNGESNGQAEAGPRENLTVPEPPRTPSIKASPPETGSFRPEDAEAILRELGNVFSQVKAPEEALPTPASLIQRELRRAEIRFQTLVESIPAVTFLASLNDPLNELYVSPQIEALLGFSQKEWLENPVLWYWQLHPDDRTRWHTEFAHTCATGKPFVSEYRFLARDGRIVWVRGEAKFIHDESGTPIYLQGVALDITAVKQAEEVSRTLNQTLSDRVAERTADLESVTRQLTESNALLRSSEVRLQAILDTTVDGIVTINADGIIESFNQAAERLFGYQAGQVIGKNVSMLMPSPYTEEHDRYLSNYRETGIRKIVGIGREVVGRRRDGSTFPMDLSVSEVILEGKQLFTGLVRDISRQTQINQALQEAKSVAEEANHAKSEFLSRMSHELRTPLNAILGFGQLLELDELSSDQRESVDQIKRGGRHLLNLINEVLDIARIEAGRMDISLEPVRIEEVIGEVLELVQPLGARREIRFRLDLAGATGVFVLADNTKLKQVLLNLISNGVKYNRERGELCLSCAFVPPRRFRLTVGDTGRGIPADKLSRLFTPFDRLGAEQSGVEGSGLGLALSKRLVELMGGVVSVTSEVGRGSRFSVDMPLAEDPHAGPEADPEKAQEAAVGPEEVRTVLYIEDNLDNLRLIERILSHRRGIHLLTAMQGSLGLELAKQYLPDLILLDVHLPDLNGDKVLAHLRQDPETRSIPVVVISADAMPRQIEKLRAAGANDYLTKPIDVPRFLDIVGELLKDKTRDP